MDSITVHHRTPRCCNISDRKRLVVETAAPSVFGCGHFELAGLDWFSAAASATFVCRDLCHYDSGFIYSGGKRSCFAFIAIWEFFWLTGILSSVLDNTPTYLTFVALAKSVVGSHKNLIFADLQQFIQYGVHAEQLLKAISLGAVFMGANSYIGNGPNFMVRSIAEERGLPMPSFLATCFSPR